LKKKEENKRRPSYDPHPLHGGKKKERRMKRVAPILLITSLKFNYLA